MCLYPKIVRNPKYRMNNKNGGQVPPISDMRVLATPVGCGRCMECRKQNSRNWQVRLLEDIKHEKNGKFVTLTFSNDEIAKIVKGTKDNNDKWITKPIEGLSGYELDNEIAIVAVKRFRERWRKTYGKSIRHWLVTELGHNGTENMHMHGIVWTDESNEEIEKHWRYGKIWVGTYVNERTVNYSTKYITKVDQEHKYYKPKVLTSKGIGAGYLKRSDSKKNKYQENGETNETYRTRSGHKIALPVYYRNKIYNDEQKEKLWIEKLDKNERWVGGERVDVSVSDEEYYKMLEYYRAKNKRLGYGDDEKNWERKNYENERRRLRLKERMENYEKRSKSGDAEKASGYRRPDDSSLTQKKATTQDCRLASPEKGAREKEEFRKGIEPSNEWE